MYFLDSHDTGSMTKSAENCKVWCLESIKKAKDEFNCDVKGVVTDNARSMEKMRKDLLEQDSDLIVYGCSAHWLQLFGRDCIPSATTKHITVVQTYFRNHHKHQAWLNEKGDGLLTLQAWLGLLSEHALRPHEKVVNKRFQDAITVEHITAYMLHPKYRAEKLTVEQQQDVSTWLANRDPGFITSFIQCTCFIIPESSVCLWTGVALR